MSPTYTLTTLWESCRYVINMTLPDKSEDYVHRVGRVGRADVMGLAISIVSEKELEKVWYCSKKGYKPWLSPTRSDVRTNDEGGHTIWYVLLSKIIYRSDDFVNGTRRWLMELRHWFVRARWFKLFEYIIPLGDKRIVVWSNSTLFKGDES